MKLARIGAPGQERPVVVVDDTTPIDLSGLTDDIDERFLGSDGIARVRYALETQGSSLPRVPLDGVRFGAPVARPHQVLCIGLNYAAHASESGMELPAEPVVFSKAPNSVVGPNDDVAIPPGSTANDSEVELAVVIGRRARYLPDEGAAAVCIAGYTISNDVSERHWQLERGGQWIKGKSAETFNPPWARGWSPPTRSVTRRHSRWSSRSTAR